ncbi:aldo/keto reductase [Streptomyces sp. NPDC092369]|uniref:aldo/keto reductase n=1 Tax=Streptomyces sp. NPDC092369 TaxID=3366015 RepID=UPI0037F6DCE6
MRSKVLEQVAADLGATVRTTALAWLLHRSPTMLLIPGTSSRAHLAENIAAADLRLPEEVLGALDAVADTAHMSPSSSSFTGW